MISSPQHPKLLNLLQKFAYIKMGLHSFCCRVRQGTDGEVFSPGRPSQGEKGGGNTQNPNPPLKSRPVPPPPLPPPVRCRAGSGDRSGVSGCQPSGAHPQQGGCRFQPPPPPPRVRPSVGPNRPRQRGVGSAGGLGGPAGVNGFLMVLLPPVAQKPGGAGGDFSA